MASLADVLTRSRLGLTESRFVELVEQSLAEIGGPALADPRSALSASEAAALTAVNADLSSLRAHEPDPRAATVAAYTALLADALPVAMAAERLGIDPSRVRHRLARHQLIGIRQSRGWLLPAYQFGSDGRLLPGLERVAVALSGIHPVVAARFFATPQVELVIARRRQTPRQWLESGGDAGRVGRLADGLQLLA